jgi:hypothetical protein
VRKKILCDFHLEVYQDRDGNISIESRASGCKDSLSAAMIMEMRINPTLLKMITDAYQESHEREINSEN